MSNQVIATANNNIHDTERIRDNEIICNEESTSLINNSDIVDISKTIKIANTEKATILSFTSCDHNLYSPRQPKLTKSQIEKLSPLLEIVTPYNHALEESSKLSIEKEQ